MCNKISFIYLNVKVYPEYNPMIETVNIINSTETNANRVKKIKTSSVRNYLCYIVACERFSDA